MPKEVLIDPFISINAVDMSEYFTSVEVSFEADTPESTGFGSDGWREYEGGLKNVTLSMDYINDYGSATFDDRIFALFGTKTAFVIRPDDGALAVTNPQYSGMGIINSYMPVSGSVGELSSGSLGVQGSGTFTRATS